MFYLKNITHYITIFVYYVCMLLPIKSDQFCFQTVYSYILLNAWLGNNAHHILTLTIFYLSFFAVVFPSKQCQYCRYQFNITHPWKSDVWRCRLDCVISAGWKITSVEVRVSLHSVRRGTPCLWPPDRRSWASRQKSEFAGPQSRHQCFHRFLALQHELVSIRMVAEVRI